MIYLFIGNNDFLLRQKVSDWKKAYVSKHGDFGLIHFKDIEKIDNNVISSELLGEGFMGEKKLIIIDNLPVSSSNTSKQLQEKQEFIFSLIEKIPENNIVLFNSCNPDKRGKFYKKLKKISDKLEEFNSSSSQEIFSIVSKKYDKKINREAINALINYKAGNLEKIISELEKLLILKEYIELEDVKQNIFPELEESIFQLIDDIMNLNISESIKKMEIILSQTSVYAFYNNLIANLRVLVFIQKLKRTNSNSLTNNSPHSFSPKGRELGQKDISEILDLKNRAFLVTKSYRISVDKLEKLYIGLIELDKKMKSGKMIGSEEDVLKYEIEKELLKVKERLKNYF